MPRGKKEPEKRAPGRPPRTGSAADVRIALRITDEERENWLTAAGAKPLGQWIRERCNLSAKRAT